MAIRIRQLVSVALSLAVSCTLGACLKRSLKQISPCLVSRAADTLNVTTVNRIDLLFVVDNSDSMKEEQVALREQFPHLISVLTTGIRTPGGRPEFSPAKDVHLGVVSSDMGLYGVSPQVIRDLNGTCAYPGDDGLLIHTSHGQTTQACQTTFPSFLTYSAGTDDPTKTAESFGCIATLGTSGCGYEHQLEAPLKALWPSKDEQGQRNMPPYGFFLGDPGTSQQLGHGDVENANFLRHDADDPSLIAIVVVTDEEDCSSKDTHHFIPDPDLPAGDPILSQDYHQYPNLRCFENKSELWPVDRYIKGFKALRPGHEELVVFAAITGVPSTLVDAASLRAVDFADMTQREAFYDNLLASPDMTERVDPASFMDTQHGPNLMPSCTSNHSVAYPPRRIVEVARGFGQNGIVQSICQDDFGPALDAITSVIGSRLGSMCLPRPLVRTASGKVGCDVMWDLPSPDKAQAGVPKSCADDQFEFLLEPDNGVSRTNARGGATCRVAQLALSGMGAARVPVATETDGVMYRRGWYYDDFSDGAATQCTGLKRQRIALSDGLELPVGVTQHLECVTEIQTLPNTGQGLDPSVEQPQLGDPCQGVTLNGRVQSGDAACQRTLLAKTRAAPEGIDKSMFCHPDLNVCVLGCTTDADCPAAFVCDARAATLAATHERKLCVNPTCGDLK